MARTVEVVAPDSMPASLLDLLPSDEPMAWLYDQVAVGDRVVVYWS